MKGGLNYGQYQFNINNDIFDYIHNKKRHLSEQIRAALVLYRLR